jgi:ribosome maturation protein Sdo1
MIVTPLTNEEVKAMCSALQIVLHLDANSDFKEQIQSVLKKLENGNIIKFTKTGDSNET